MMTPERFERFVLTVLTAAVRCETTVTRVQITQGTLVPEKSVACVCTPKKKITFHLEENDTLARICEYLRGTE